VSVAAEGLDREALVRDAEGEVDLGGPARAASGDRPAVVEPHAGRDLARRQHARVRARERADERVDEREGMDGLLVDDVRGRLEHPVGDLPRLELRERRRERRPHVLDAPDPAAFHALQ
jgi:hypothetical protein